MLNLCYCIEHFLNTYWDNFLLKLLFDLQFNGKCWFKVISLLSIYVCIHICIYVCICYAYMYAYVMHICMLMLCIYVCIRCLGIMYLIHRYYNLSWVIWKISIHAKHKFIILEFMFFWKYLFAFQIIFF